MKVYKNVIYICICILALFCFYRIHHIFWLRQLRSINSWTPSDTCIHQLNGGIISSGNDLSPVQHQAIILSTSLEKKVQLHGHVDFIYPLFNKVKSLAAGRFVVRWMSLDLYCDKVTLVQVMAWCSQATSHDLSQCWPRSISPYGVSRPQRVKGVSSCLSVDRIVYMSLIPYGNPRQGSKLRGAEGQNAPKLSPNAPGLLNLGAKFCYPIQPDICFEA